MKAGAAAISTEHRPRDPKNRPTRNRLGEIYQKLAGMKEALVFYQRGFALKPDRADLHLNLARAYLTAGRRDDARIELQAAIDRAPVGSEVDSSAREELRRLSAGG